MLSLGGAVLPAAHAGPAAAEPRIVSRPGLPLCTAACQPRWRARSGFVSSKATPPVPCSKQQTRVNSYSVSFTSLVGPVASDGLSQAACESHVGCVCAWPPACALTPLARVVRSWVPSLGPQGLGHANVCACMCDTRWARMSSAARGWEELAQLPPPNPVWTLEGV